MPKTDAELAMLNEFASSYRNAAAPVVQAIERRVCGCDYGGTSWTTRAEAEMIARALSLAPEKTLLEIGAGSGWPSLYLVKLTGCKAVLTDLPAEGLRAASERAKKDGTAHRCVVMQADGAALPFEDASFDAISHSDVLCCLPDKLGVLRECRRLISESGRMAFPVIYLPPHLPAADLAEALSAGPSFVASDTDYETMLSRTRWRLVSRTDLTAAFAQSMRRMVEAREAHGDQLATLLGAAEAKDTLNRMQQKLPAIERRLLERALFVVEPV